MKPSITIIMGTLNSEKWVIDSIKSIQEQTFKDWEFIICDDGSTDGTFEVLNKIAKEDSRLIIFKNEKNMGHPYTLNKCIEKSSSKYIARMDDDDFSYEDRLIKQKKFLDENPDYSLVGTGRNLFDENGVWSTHLLKEKPNVRDVFKGSNFVHPSVMMRREDLLKVGCYDSSPDIGRTEDFDLWCKFYYYGLKGYNLKEPLLKYRESKNSFSKRKYRYRIIEFKLKKKWRKLLKLPLIYEVFCYKTLLIGLIPDFIYRKIRKVYFNKR